MEKILDAIMSGADSATIGALSIPDNYRAAHILASEATMWEGVESEERPTKKRACRRRRHTRIGTRRGLCGRHGKQHQLQHGVVKHF